MNRQQTIKFHSRKLRIGRHSEPNGVYLITTATHMRRPLFKDFMLGRIVIKSMQTFHQKGYLNSLAYVVMPDHAHWLFQLNDRKSLAETMRQFKGYSAFKVNKAMNISYIKVWQSGYHDHALREEEDIKNIARYMIANPLRAGLAEHIGDYPLWDAAWL